MATSTHVYEGCYSQTDWNDTVIAEVQIRATYRFTPGHHGGYWTPPESPEVDILKIEMEVTSGIWREVPESDDNFDTFLFHFEKDRVRERMIEQAEEEEAAAIEEGMNRHYERNRERLKEMGR